MSFHVGDWVSFNFGNTKKVGKIVVCDYNGTFFNPDVPSVDVYVKYENMVYKHLPMKDIVSEQVEWAAGQQDDMWYGCDY